MTGDGGCFVVTGAEGFLGAHIVAALVAQRRPVVAGYVDPVAARRLPSGVQTVRCDVTDPASLDRLFAQPGPVTVVHSAGLVSIANRADAQLWRVNVGGTAAVVEAARRHGVRRLVYVSSVHALPELPPGSVVREIADFSPDAVVGAYARTKAEATRLVLAADDLDRVVVHPSALLGPGDHSGHLTEAIKAMLTGSIPATVNGSHDIVDVRDVASAVVKAALFGRRGACYVLSGHEVSMRWISDRACAAANRPRLPAAPLLVARALAEIAAPFYRLTRQTPKFTRYSLHVLRAGQVYDHSAATRDLGFDPRPVEQTIDDTIRDLLERG